MDIKDFDVSDKSFVVTLTDVGPQDSRLDEFSPEEAEEATTAESVAIVDTESDLQPHHLGILLDSFKPSEDPLPPIHLYSDAAWVPDSPLDLDSQLDPDVYENLREILALMTRYGKEDADRGDILRDLMKFCDELMEKLPEAPDAVERLDEYLWEWFQDQPDPDDLIPEMDDILIQFIEDQLGDGSAEADKSTEESDETKLPDDDQWDAETLSSLEYSELQSLAKERDIAANQSMDDIIDALLEEAMDHSEAETEPAEETAPAGEETVGETGGEETKSGDVMRRELDVDPSIVRDFLKEANDHLQQLDNLLVKAEEDPTENVLDELFRSMHTLKGGFGFCGLETCTDLTHAAEDLLDNLQDDTPDEIPPEWMDLFFDTLDNVRDICAAMEEAVEEEEDVLVIPVSGEYLEALESDLRKACDGVRDPDEFKSHDIKSEEAGGAEEDDVDQQELGEETVSIELSKIGELVDLVGELSISHSELKEQFDTDVSRKIENVLNQQEKILDQLQRRSMNLRMLPLKKEFDKFPRIVRDISRDLGKKVDLKISGADTEIDKSVLDALHGPLVHLVRNAVDHGLESPEERRESGKGETGTVNLRAYHESGHVYIEVEDDGSGIPRDIIEEKAIDKGLIEEDNDLDDEELDRLIFHPGFSTTEEVSDVSGRGVGMDVVASEIEKLRGRIDIDSTPGEGTKITIELPLTVAIIDGLITRIGSERLIFPVSQVVESINPDPGDIQHVQEKGQVVQVREQVIPLIEPADFLEDMAESADVDDRTIFVIVRSQSGQYAIRVDRLLSHEQVVIKSLEGRELEGNDLISGGAILGDGSVGLILDVAGIVRAYREEQEESVAA